MRYRVLAPMMLHPGALLGLTAEQAAARSFGLQAEGVQWRVVKPVGFKAGEEIEHEGDLPKVLAHAIEPVSPADDAAPQPAVAPRKAAPAKRTRA